MRRVLVLFLLALSLALMGALSCRYSSGGGKKKRGSGVQVVVDTRISNSSRRSGSEAVVRTALSASVLPLSSPSSTWLPPSGSAGGGTRPELILAPEDLVDLAFRSIEVASFATSSGHPAPEPSAGWLFASGVTLVAWQLRRRPLRKG